MSDSIETTTALPSATRQIARAAGTVMIAFIISNIIGLLRGVLIYRTFGTGVELDSFNASNRVTEVLYNLIAGGALGSAFIPTFTGFLTRKDRQGAWKLASGVINLLILALLLICTIAFIFAPQIVEHGLFILNPAASLGQLDLTTNLLRILLPSIIIFGVSGLVMGMLNSHQIFWIPALAPAMYSIGMILGILIFPASWGIYRLAWGALLGSLLHLVVQIPYLFKLHYKYQFILGTKIAEVRQVFRLFLPRVFGVAVVQLNFIINTIIALSLAEGSASAITLAFSLMLMPQMAIAQSIAIASLPTFAAQVEENRLDDMRSSLSSTLRSVFLLALPAAVGMILLRTPLIQLLYENGTSFTAHSTELVAWALLWYAAGLVGHSIVEIISRAFYALHDTRTPVFVGVIAMSLNIALSFGFAALFSALGWMPHGGLALALSLSTSLEAIALLVIMRTRLGGLQGKQFWRVIAQSALAAGIMSAALLGWLWLAKGTSPWLSTLVGLVISVAVYFAVLIILKVPELRSFLGMLNARLKQNKKNIQEKP